MAGGQNIRERNGHNFAIQNDIQNLMLMQLHPSGVNWNSIGERVQVILQHISYGNMNGKNMEHV